MTCEYPDGLSEYSKKVIAHIMCDEHTNEPKLKLPHADMHHLYHLMWEQYQAGEVTLKALSQQAASYFGRDWYPFQQCVYAHFSTFHGYAPKADPDKIPVVEETAPRDYKRKLGKCGCLYPEGASDGMGDVVKRMLNEPHDGAEVIKLSRHDLHYLEHHIWEARGIYGWGTLMRLCMIFAPWMNRSPSSLESSVVTHFKLHHDYAPNGVKYKPSVSKYQPVICSYPEADVNESLIKQLVSGEVYDTTTDLTDDDMMALFHAIWEQRDPELSGSLRELAEPIAELLRLPVKSLLAKVTRHFVSSHGYVGVAPKRWTRNPKHDPKGVPCLYPAGDIDEVVVERAVGLGGLEYKLLTVDERHAIVHIVRDKVTSDPLGQWCAQIAPNIGMTKDSLSSQVTRHFKMKH